MWHVQSIYQVYGGLLTQGRQAASCFDRSANGSHEAAR